MNTILDLLNGKKTYLVSGAALLVVAGWMFGYIDQAIAEKALVALGFGGAITLRAGIAKSEAKAEQATQQVAALTRGRRDYIG